MVAYQIYKKLLRLTFNASQSDEVFNSKCGNFNEEKLYLLFLWPLIITKRYLYPYLELELTKDQYKLYYILEKEADKKISEKNFASFIMEPSISKRYREIDKKFSNNVNNFDNHRNLIDYILELHKELEEETGFFNYTKIKKNDPDYKLIDLAFGGKIDSKNKIFSIQSDIRKKIEYAKLMNGILNCENTANRIRNGIFCYYIILSLLMLKLMHKDSTTITYLSEVFSTLIEFFDEDNKDKQAFFSNVIEIFTSCGVDFFSHTIWFFIIGYNEIFFKDKTENNIKYEEHVFFKNNPNYFATIYISNYDLNTNPIYNICINREILISNEYNYKLEICIDRNLNNNTIDDSFLFTFGESNDNEEKLLHCLSIISYKLSKHIDNYSEAYNNFIINTDFSVDKDFKKNSNNFDTIQNSYYMFNEYLNHKNFSRAIENLDIDIENSSIKEIKKIRKIRKKKKNHLSVNQYNDLLTANKEISILFNAVQRKKENQKNKLALEYFSENPHFFKIIKYNDIKHVDFISIGNGIRDSRRKIFYNILKRQGKEIAGSKIAKELALE